MITSLPTTRQPILETNPKVLILYGAPKVGKTEVLSMLDRCFIIDLEDGTDYVEALKQKVNNITELSQVFDLVYKMPSPKPYKYLAIDTADKMEEWCEVVATAKYKNSVLGKTFTGQSVLELPKGAGYLWLRMEFNRFFAMAQQTGVKYIIFICHIRDKALVAGDKTLQTDGTFKTVVDNEVSAKDLDLTGKVKSIACSKADAIGHMYRDKTGVLCVSFQGSESVNCGSRCSHLKGKDMKFDWKQIYLEGK